MQSALTVGRIIRYNAYQKYGFPGHPAYRQGHGAIDFVIIARVQFVVRTEIRDFNVISFAHQAIPVIEILVIDESTVFRFHKHSMQAI